MESLEEHLLNVHVILISTAAWFILWTLRRVWKKIDTNFWLSRYKPLYPALLCQAFVWIPGALPAEQDPTIGYRILIALWCGFLASIGYQIVKRVLLPRGVDLPDNPQDLLPSSGSDGRSPDEKGEWKSPATSSETTLVNTRRETPAAIEGTGRSSSAFIPPPPAQPPGVPEGPSKALPQPPKIQTQRPRTVKDLFKPPKD